MKFIATSDWHMKLWPDSEVTVDNIPKRLDELLSAVTQICDYARANNIKLIVVAGDTNDKKHILDVKAFTRLKRVLESYPDLDFVFLHGNHDSTARIDYDSAVELLTNNQNISCVLSSPEVSEDIGALYLPYSKEMSDHISESESVNILIGHFGVNEAQLSNGHSIKTSISARDLSKFKLVLLGHYHKPQQLDNIWYMGSLIQLRRDETGE